MRTRSTVTWVRIRFFGQGFASRRSLGMHRSSLYNRLPAPCGSYRYILRSDLGEGTNFAPTTGFS
jgi:hypothetical protein